MTYSISDFFNTLFERGDKVNIREIKDDSTGAKNYLYDMPSAPTCSTYPDSFPCAGINPRETVKKLSAIKNLVIDIDDGELPAWVTERANIVCSRDDKHHHVYFCFTDTTREKYKEFASKLIATIPNADRAVSDPERVIRLPGFAHRKNGVEGEGYKIIFIRQNVERVAIEEKFNWLKKAAVSQQTHAPQSSAVDYLRALYSRKPIVSAGEGRGRDVLLLGFDCHFWGIEKEIAYELALDIARDRHSPPEPDEAIRTLIDNAFKYAKGAFGAAHTGATAAGQHKIKKEFELIQRVREKTTDWVFIHSACRLVNVRTGEAMTTREQIEDFITQEVGATINLRKLLAGAALETCRGIEYLPTEEKRVMENSDGVKTFNSYRANTEAMPRKKELEQSAKNTFLEHVNFIGTSAEERVTLLKYFAYCVQNVGKKVDWTPLIISPQEGLGKSAFGVLFRKMFGEHNCSTVSAQKLLSGWTDFVAEKLFVISHEVETDDKTVLVELKALITESRVSVNAKYARTYETNNCANFMLLSNKTTAVRLDERARRFFVIVNRNTPKEKEYYNILFDAMENGAGWIYDLLMSEDLTDFDPHGAAPKTEGLAMLIDASKSDLTAWLDEQLEHKRGAFADKILNLKKLEDEARMEMSGTPGKFSRKTITDYLHKSGFVQKDYWIHSAHLRGWFRGTEDEYKAELAALRDGKPSLDEIPF